MGEIFLFGILRSCPNEQQNTLLEKWFLYYLKSSFGSKDIEVFVMTFLVM